MTNEGGKDIQGIAANLVLGPITKDLLIRAREEICRGNGNILLQDMLEVRNKERQAEASKVIQANALVSFMTLLESMMDVDQVVATCLMTRLYPVASQIYLHEVCDAIDLWMDQASGEELEKYLKIDAAWRGNSMAAKYKQWLKNIEKKNNYP